MAARLQKLISIERMKNLLNLIAIMKEVFFNVLFCFFVVVAVVVVVFFFLVFFPRGCFKYL